MSAMSKLVFKESAWRILRGEQVIGSVAQIAPTVFRAYDWLGESITAPESPAIRLFPTRAAAAEHLARIVL